MSEAKRTGAVEPEAARSEEPGASPAPPPRLSLWEYEAAIAAVLAELGDEVPPDDETPEAKERRERLDRELDGLLSREAVKIDSVAAVLERLGGTAEELKKRAAALSKRAKRFEGDRERLAQHVLEIMKTWGAKKLSGLEHDLTRIQNADTVEVDEAVVARLPFVFRRTSFSFVPRTQEEQDELAGLLDRFEGEVSHDPEKAALKKVLTVEGKKVEADLGLAPAPEGAEAIEPMPDSVADFVRGGRIRLKPGTWRLAVR